VLVTEVTVRVETCFSHPAEKFSNFKPSVTLRAQIQPGENYWTATEQLQRTAESLLEAQRQQIVARHSPIVPLAVETRQGALALEAGHVV
jgi:hypothetical protein